LLLIISSVGINSDIELKLLQAETTGFALSQRALIFGSGTMYFATSFGFIISLPIRLSSSRFSGHAN
jgi:hypothetical protein